LGYPSGHATVSPAAAVVLQASFGHSGDFTLDSEVVRGVLHRFVSFATAADKAFVARIYGGIHSARPAGTDIKSTLLSAATSWRMPRCR
jgi:hypothetical protein